MTLCNFGALNHRRNLYDMKKIAEFDFDAIKKISPECYCDGDIAFHNSIGAIPFEDNAVRLDLAVILGCRTGKFHAEINGYPMTIKSNEVIILKPNDSVSEPMISPDFDGVVLCLSLGVLAECVSNRKLWRNVYQLKDNPIIAMSEQSIRMFELYGEIVKTKTKNIPTEFTRDILYATIKSALNEIAENIPPSVFSTDTTITQGEVLFKKFLELISHKRIKPRMVEWYAKQLCVTPKYLSYVCKNQLGKTAHDIIDEFVFADIRNLLKNSDKSIKEIVHYLDFPSISFFGKYVKARTGMSPTKYRNSLVSGEIK